MTTAATAKQEATMGLAPFSLKDVPSFIEAQFPVGRLSAEAFKERDSKQAQTLTGLGSYWIGRKPLILVRAVVIGSLMPASSNPTVDLDVFLKLLAMDDRAFGRRFNGSASEFARIFPSWAELLTEDTGRRRSWREDLSELDRADRISEALATLPYKERLKLVRRPEECDERILLGPVWAEVNRHLNTNANSIASLTRELGVARFGHAPRVSDTFSGGGSLPYEAARMGCDVSASDLNPIACMLTWGAFNVVGAAEQDRSVIEAIQSKVAATVQAQISNLGIELDSHGNQAKAYLYCLETRCPKTGWLVPMLATQIVSRSRNIIAELVPVHADKRYEILVREAVDDLEMAAAAVGTIRDGRLVHPMNPEKSGVDLAVIRGDARSAEGNNTNQLRAWTKTDFMPRAGDVYQERLYCIQWIAKETVGRGRQTTFFSSVTNDDLDRERRVEALVRNSLTAWQEAGYVPDMPIEPGDKTDEPIRTRGWTHWHHLFCPRQLLYLALLMKEVKEAKSPHLYLSFARTLDWTTKLCRYGTGAARESISQTFDTMALDPLIQYGVRSSSFAKNYFLDSPKQSPIFGNATITTSPASRISSNNDLYITDPPYADAVVYHEITEFFIAWLRKNPPSPFHQWTWDSQRRLAIKGKDEDFRRDMVDSYSAMTKHMSNNGLQVVMFTHQDAGVWADLGGILWAAGLSVSAAWNVVTETEKPSGKGNYVQGTVCLVLRKRLQDSNARRMEIEAEIEEAVASQLNRLTALDDAWTAETLYTDGDLTLAAYAAALQVVTSYSTIDRQPLDRDLYRKLAKGERSMIRDLVDYAAQVANGMLVPTDFPRDMWRDLGAPERFYVRMLDMEAKGSAKVADFQNFAKSFAFGDYTSVMASTTANAASLAGAADLKGGKLDGEGFFATQLRQVLFAIWKTLEKGDPKLGVTTLRTEYAADYWQRRQKLTALAAYVAAKTKHTRPEESAAAHELVEALKLDRV